MATSYAESYFDKPIDEITPNDIINFFVDEREENLTLEFKSFHIPKDDAHKEKPNSKENGLLKAICAFLNSSGGLLIWGAPGEKRRENGIKVVQGELSPIPKLFLKDSFISKLTHRIIPFAAPVRFMPVEVSPGNFVYLIDVPESEVKPHQFENVYHIRLDGQSIPAPHYVIDALFKQVKRPSLDIQLSHHKSLPYSPMTRDNCEVELHLSGKIFNLTESVNEKNIYYRIQTSEGDIIKDKRFQYFTKDVLREGVRTILPNGLEASFEEVVKYRYTSSDDDAFINITITAGGELSTPFIKTFHYLLVRKVDERGYVVDVGVLSHISAGREERNPLREIKK